MLSLINKNVLFAVDKMLLLWMLLFLNIKVVGWQIGFLRVIPPSVSFLEICLSFLEYESVILSKNTCHSPYLRACHSAENFWSMCHSVVTNVSFLLSFYETYSVILLCHSSMTNVSFLTDQCVIPYWPMCRSLPTNVSFRTDQCVIPMCHSVCPTLSFRWSQNVIPLKRYVIPLIPKCHSTVINMSFLINQNMSFSLDGVSFLFQHMSFLVVTVSFSGHIEEWKQAPLSLSFPS